MAFSRSFAPRTLVLTLDAFGTIYKPRIPIARKYIEEAKACGIEGLVEENVDTSFQLAYKQTNLEHPHYGTITNLRQEEWWKLVVDRTLLPLTNMAVLPPRLHSRLWSHYGSSEGYELYSDVKQLIQLLRSSHMQRHFLSSQSRWKNVVLGILSDSDRRTYHVLKSFRIDARFNAVQPNMVKSDSDSWGRGPHRVPDISFFSMGYLLGVNKPNAQSFDITRDFVFRHILPQGLITNDVIFAHVGDSSTKDAEGALKAGWHGIHLQRDTPEYALVPFSKEVSLVRTNRTSNMFRVSSLEAMLVDANGEPVQHISEAFPLLHR